MMTMNEPNLRIVMTKTLFIIMCMFAFSIYARSGMAGDLHMRPFFSPEEGPPYEDRSFEQRSLGMLPSNVYILNDSYDTLYFHYQSGGQKGEIEISAADDRELPCSDDTHAEIRVNTGNRHVEYPLRCRSIYVLYWNSHERLWDVAQLRD